jgi:phage terminase small subunit
MADKLTSKQQSFISAYLANGFNATQAAIEAGYSPDTARQQGSRLLTNVDIKSVLDAKLTEQAMSANEVLARLADHARGDMRDFAALTLENLGTHPRGNLIKKLKLDVNFDSQNKAHHFIESFELYDAQAALIQLARVHGLLKDKQEITGADGGAIEIKSVDYRTGLDTIKPADE